MCRWNLLLLVVVFPVQLSAQDWNVLEPTDVPPSKWLYRYLEAEAKELFDVRRQAIAALETPEDVQRRQAELKGRFIEALGGLPEKTPLNARVVGQERRDGYSIEKVIYESRPNHHVTGVLYLPDGKAPFPGVLVPCGHSANGKAAEPYQRVCILLAKNGLAVLCYDPIGQGERLQLLTSEGKPAIPGSTTEHTHGRRRRPARRPEHGDLPHLGRHPQPRLPRQPAGGRSRSGSAAPATPAAAR